jgi:hypothetical protein
MTGGETVVRVVCGKGDLVCSGADPWQSICSAVDRVFALFIENARCVLEGFFGGDERHLAA